MKIRELKEKLKNDGIPERWYVINGSLLTDSYILSKVFNYWECFYFDEKGNINDYKRFESEEDACDYFLELLHKELAAFSREPEMYEVSEEQNEDKEKIIYL